MSASIPLYHAGGLDGDVDVRNFGAAGSTSSLRTRVTDIEYTQRQGIAPIVLWVLCMVAFTLFTASPAFSPVPLGLSLSLGIQALCWLFVFLPRFFICLAPNQATVLTFCGRTFS